ncbi:hypothetical protein [Natrarchaeobius oligotrophus]|uniref:Uncharacterized protein n=1 Tax=Natrarchaeobius chitinivorans TaxID=1679083 RepID=A0A3N6M9A2_NATCH|nr:hypothetical protein [Natrarchaeobius chitinivorans]RQH00279.1 hypothetical protein EA472_10455 [Natrarchaeobius chitinivorans]
MDLTQIGLGIGLLVVSGLTFLGPSVLDSGVIAALAGTALLIGAIAVLTSVARDARTPQEQ